MFNWAKQQLANVAGTQEPEYGPGAIQPVTKQCETVPYTELKKEDLQWRTIDVTSVETQTFYITSDDGHVAFAQVIYSNVAGIKTTVQFSSKLIFPNHDEPVIWSTDALENYRFSKDKCSFYANNCSMELSEDGNSYTIQSTTGKQCVVNIKFTRDAPGFVVGKDGTSYFGTDPAKPWGSMRHAFWPRCKVEGTFITKSGETDLKGTGMYVHALQGMKPHHAAATWNFVNFHSPNITAVIMDFTTPPSYGRTPVKIGGIVRNNEILMAGAGCTADHTEIKGDEDSGWPEPSGGKYTWKGKNKDGAVVEAELSGSLGPRRDRIDIMAEVPKFVKQIVAAAAGTKPYIYQFAPKLTIKLKIGDEVIEEEGTLFTEATFITSLE
ncbi:oxidative stress survival, Svf1-like protein [Trichodelitschia bisporula]|uniref:Ceramide-binding protein SVF1 n=1 Tax=Trichodelitschia bisporula TaxID=703511 RepID=A0A6G1HL38_9PEZI|nr:oxidative stress survival, Svf1-like protein [Trichodelitschia bisporula]